MRKPGRKPYVRETKPGFLYLYRGGKYLYRFTAAEGTEEFDRQYWQAMTGKTQEAKRSWAAAIQILRTSDRWAEKSGRYRQDLEPVLAYLEDKIGKWDVARLTPVHVFDAMQRNRHRVRFANYIPVAISMIYRELKPRGWLTVNPATEIERLKVPKERQQPHKPWPDAAVAKFRAEAGPLERLIFEIGIGTVQRPSDWLQFTWGDYDPAGDGTLRLRQGKTGIALILPCTVALRAALDAARAALPFAPMPTLHIIRKQDGSRMTYRRMAEIMLAERVRLGLADYDLHALRYRGVRELARAGCDDDEIMSYSGHATREMVKKYAGEERQIMRAQQAREKRR